MPRKAHVHKQAIYYLPTSQGGDVLVPLCRRSTEGYWDSLNLPRLADIGISCPLCLTLMDQKAVPTRARQQQARAA